VNVILNFVPDVVAAVKALPSKNSVWIS